MSRILVIEDDKSISDIITVFLGSAGYETAAAFDGLEGIEKFRAGKFDLVLLDILLPKISGYVVLDIIRRESDVPVIMLTALDDDESEMKGFNLQADDYVTKPFSVPLLIKRIEAVLRRTAVSKSGKGILYYKDISMDTRSYQVWVRGEEIMLTSREFELLRFFLENKGQVFTREQILARIWDYGFEGEDKVVNTHIKNIRKKLGVECIETVRGVGYRIGKGN